MTKQSNDNHKWHLLDAKEVSLGRLATQTAIFLRGKQKVQFKLNVDSGDHVVVTNIEQVKLTGDKLNQKKYYSHSGYLGNLKTIPIKSLSMKEVFERSVAGMLPNNKLKSIWLKRLHIYEGNEHPHEANLAEK